jgi:hypothetical protein
MGRRYGLPCFISLSLISSGMSAQLATLRVEPLGNPPQAGATIPVKVTLMAGRNGVWIGKVFAERCTQGISYGISVTLETLLRKPIETSGYSCASDGEALSDPTEILKQLYLFLPPGKSIQTTIILRLIDPQQHGTIRVTARYEPPRYAVDHISEWVKPRTLLRADIVSKPVEVTIQGN